MKIPKLIRDIKAGKIKDKFIIEGSKWIGQYPNIEIETWVVDEKNADIAKNTTAPVVILGDKQIKKLSDTTTPQGILAICKKKHFSLQIMPITQPTFILMLDKINDPGNMGTIIRSALAFGVHFVITSTDCVDIYNPKVIRATAGAIFTLPIIQNTDLPQAQTYLHSKNINTIATSPHAPIAHYNTDLTKGICIIAGNESTGISEQLLNSATTQVKIPTTNIESLNVSIATAIILQETLRQRMGVSV